MTIITNHVPNSLWSTQNPCLCILGILKYSPAPIARHGTRSRNYLCPKAAKSSVMEKGLAVRFPVLIYLRSRFEKIHVEIASPVIKDRHVGWRNERRNIRRHHSLLLIRGISPVYFLQLQRGITPEGMDSSKVALTLLFSLQSPHRRGLYSF